MLSHTHTFNGPLSRTTRVSRYQKSKTNLDFTEARDSELRWHQLGHMQVCTSLQTDNHASNPPPSFLQAGCPSCSPTNSVKALKGNAISYGSNYYSTEKGLRRTKRDDKPLLACSLRLSTTVNRLLPIISDATVLLI